MPRSTTAPAVLSQRQRCVFNFCTCLTTRIWRSANDFGVCFRIIACWYFHNLDRAKQLCWARYWYSEYIRLSVHRTPASCQNGKINVMLYYTIVDYLTWAKTAASTQRRLQSSCFLWLEMIGWLWNCEHDVQLQLVLWRKNQQSVHWEAKNGTFNLFFSINRSKSTKFNVFFWSTDAWEICHQKKSKVSTSVWLFTYLLT